MWRKVKGQGKGKRTAGRERGCCTQLYQNKDRQERGCSRSSLFVCFPWKWSHGNLYWKKLLKTKQRYRTEIDSEAWLTVEEYPQWSRKKARFQYLQKAWTGQSWGQALSSRETEQEGSRESHSMLQLSLLLPVWQRSKGNMLLRVTTEAQLWLGNSWTTVEILSFESWLFWLHLEFCLKEVEKTSTVNPNLLKVPDILKQWCSEKSRMLTECCNSADSQRTSSCSES